MTREYKKLALHVTTLSLLLRLELLVLRTEFQNSARGEIRHRVSLVKHGG